MTERISKEDADRLMEAVALIERSLNRALIVLVVPADHNGGVLTIEEFSHLSDEVVTELITNLARRKQQ